MFRLTKMGADDCLHFVPNPVNPDTIQLYFIVNKFVHGEQLILKAPLETLFYFQSYWTIIC